MKRLILMRHAKSSWDNVALDDFDRPLNQRGRRDAPQMGKLLNERGWVPEVIYASPALRALTTAKRAAAEMEYAEENIVEVDWFYEAMPDRVEEFVWGLANELEVVMLVGHNPTWTALSERFSGEVIWNLPTAGVMVMEFEVDEWRDVSKETLGKAEFMRP